MFALNLLQSLNWNRSTSCSFVNLPHDMWNEILKYLSPQDLIMCCCTCKTLNTYASESFLWEPIAHKHGLKLHADETAKFTYIKVKKLRQTMFGGIHLDSQVEWNTLPQDCEAPGIHKIVVIGSSSVGKTSLMYQFTEGSMFEHYVSNIGVDFRLKSLTYRGNPYKLQILDTAGQERFFARMSPSFYRGTAGVLLVFDITDRHSFEEVRRRWMTELQEAGVTSNIVLVGNKSDLDDKREVPFQELAEYATNLKVCYGEVSAKSRENVDLAFMCLVAGIGDKPVIYPKQQKQEPPKSSCGIM